MGRLAPFLFITKGEVEMEIKIGKKEYELRFGVLFNHTLDTFYKQEVEGVEFGMGLNMAYVYLQMENVTGVFNVIKAATSHLKSKPTASEISQYIEERAIEDKGITKLSNELLKAMKDSPFLSSQIKEMERGQKKVTKTTLQ